MPRNVVKCSSTGFGGLYHGPEIMQVAKNILPSKFLACSKFSKHTNWLQEIEGTLRMKETRCHEYKDSKEPCTALFFFIPFLYLQKREV